MRSSGDCLRCGKAVGGGRPNFLVVPGNFEATKSGRTFTVDGGALTPLCFQCHGELAAGEEPEPKPCKECGVDTKDESVVCRSCFNTAEGLVKETLAQPLAPGGLQLAV